MPQFEENSFAQKIKQEKYIKQQAKGICNSVDILGLLFGFLKLFSFVCQFLNSSRSFAIPCGFKLKRIRFFIYFLKIPFIFATKVFVIAFFPTLALSLEYFAYSFVQAFNNSHTILVGIMQGTISGLAYS